MPTLLPEGKAIHGFIVMARFHVALRCRRELFMLHKDYVSTGENLDFSSKMCKKEGRVY